MTDLEEFTKILDKIGIEYYEDHWNYGPGTNIALTTKDYEPVFTFDKEGKYLYHGVQI